MEKEKTPEQDKLDADSDAARKTWENNIGDVREMERHATSLQPLPLGATAARRDVLLSALLGVAMTAIVGLSSWAWSLNTQIATLTGDLKSLVADVARIDSQGSQGQRTQIDTLERTLAIAGQAQDRQITVNTEHLRQLDDEMRDLKAGRK